MLSVAPIRLNIMHRILTMINFCSKSRSLAFRLRATARKWVTFWTIKGSNILIDWLGRSEFCSFCLYFVCKMTMWVDAEFGWFSIFSLFSPEINSLCCILLLGKVYWIRFNTDKCRRVQYFMQMVARRAFFDRWHFEWGFRHIQIVRDENCITRREIIVSF